MIASRNTVFRQIAIVALLLLMAGCASVPPDRPEPVDALAGDAVAPSLPGNLRILRDMGPSLSHLESAFRRLSQQGEWKTRGYFSADESDRMEFLLFRSVAAQTALWDLVYSYGGLDATFSDDSVATRAHVLCVAATLMLTAHAAFVVNEFGDDPIAIAQINQPQYRSELPEGSYDRMRDNVTAPDLLAGVSDAGDFLAAQQRAGDSQLRQLAAASADYRELIEELPDLQETTAKRLRSVSPSMASHREAESEAHRDVRKQHQGLYAIRSVLFKDVSRLKSPTAHVLRFSDEQKKQIFQLLQPGDLILTYTAGYASDVFIPGAFKHGITYVGLPHQRDSLGLAPEMLPEVAQFEGDKIAADLDRATLADGKPANMIEAVAEGVIFNDLAHILDTHINRLVVLRPVLSDAERAQFLVEVFSYLGDAYDFRFDFSDASRQVCTEVIYRALDGKGSIDYTLTERGGHPTLSADDIANDFADDSPEAYSFILYAEADPTSTNHDAMVMVGSRGQQRLVELMAEQKDGATTR